MSFIYTPDSEQKIHTPGAIALICSSFQTHESGIPEWVKNAADAYGRADAAPEDRVIAILFRDLKKYGAPSIACLDLVGTTSQVIESHFRHWASPVAASQGRSVDVQGGHGNGGKCYMTQMFGAHSVFHTVRDGLGCRYGVQGGSTQFGYVPNELEGKDYPVGNLTNELDAALRDYGLSTPKLPGDFREALARATGFTLVSGTGPRHYEKKIRVKDIVAQIQDHTQMLASLHYAKVYLFHNGKPVKDASPLASSAIEPIPDSLPSTVEIPESLVDPADGRAYSTTSNGELEPGQLTLYTSRTSMRWKKKARHTINYRGARGFIGYKSMLKFPVESGYRDKIYGECTLTALEPFKRNDRSELVEAPLTRAVDNFIAEEVQRLAEEFERKERREYTKKERNALSRLNEALDSWKNRLIRDLMIGQFGTGGGPIVTDGLPSGKPARLEVHVTHPRLGLGVAIRPMIRFFDSGGRQIRGVPYRWVSEDTNVAMVDDDLMLINSFAPGATVIHAETLDGGLTSNRVPIQVIRIHSVHVEPTRQELRAGSRTRLRAVATLANGEQFDDVALIWTEENASVARVSSAGLVFGIGVGSTEVVAGDDRVSSNPALIEVVEAQGAGSGSNTGNGGGRRRGDKQGYPLILVSGEVDEDPETGDYVHFSPDDPPVRQRPQDADRNIWWINSAAPLAQLYLDRDAGFGYETREWRMYHLERYADILTQIAITYDAQIDSKLTKQEFFLLMADRLPELQAAIAQDLRSFIVDGTMPELDQ